MRHRSWLGRHPAAEVCLAAEARSVGVADEPPGDGTDHHDDGTDHGAAAARLQSWQRGPLSTTSAAERDNAVANGYRNEGVASQVFPSQ